MKRLAFIVFTSVITGCTVHVQNGPPDAPVAPPPPPAPVADVPPPPAPPTNVPPPAPPTGQPTTTASVTVDAPEVTTADPEEVTATTEPPDLIYEEPPDMPGPGYVWVGGYWGWSGYDWGWYPGVWLVAPAGRVYVAPYYERVGGNVVFVRGYWGPPNAPRRSYGGEQIRFVAAPRPVNYRRGEPVVIEHRSGFTPGARPASFYVRATGQVRALPRATTPTFHTATRDTEGSRSIPAGHEVERPASMTGRGNMNVTEHSHDVGEGVARDRMMPQHDEAAAPRTPAFHTAPPPARIAPHPAPLPRKKR